MSSWAKGDFVNKLILSLFLLTLAGCSSTPFPEGLVDARIGMDKAAILNLGGNPARTYHEKGQDHWIYDYRNDDQHMLRHLVFQDGLLVSIGPAYEKKVKTDSGEPEDSDDIEQLENKMKESQKPKGEFRDIP